jgi:hypothetical protein
MRGAFTPPLSNTPSWRGTQLKHKDNFTFTFKILHKEDVGGTCSTHGGEVWLGGPKGRDQQEDLAVDGRIILR